MTGSVHGMFSGLREQFFFSVVRQMFVCYDKLLFQSLIKLVFEKSAFIRMVVRL